jgi:hypothetical protein
MQGNKKVKGLTTQKNIQPVKRAHLNHHMRYPNTLESHCKHFMTMKHGHCCSIQIYANIAGW